jgi:molybdopterin-binding protein
VTARSVTELGLTEGARIVAAFKASAVQLVGRVSSDNAA